MYGFHPFLLGYAAALVLLAITAVGALRWSSEFKRNLLLNASPLDSRRVLNNATSLTLIYLFDAIILALTLQSLYCTFSHFGAPFVALLQWSGIVDNFSLAIPVPFIQSMYCLSVWKLLDGKNIVPLLVSTTITVASGLASFDAVNDFSMPHILDAPLLAALSIDTLLSALLFFCLRRRAAHSLDGTLVAGLISWVLCTSITASTAALGTMVLFSAHTEKLVWLCVYMLVTKTYQTTFIHSFSTAYRAQSAAAPPTTCENEKHCSDPALMDGHARSAV